MVRHTIRTLLLPESAVTENFLVHGLSGAVQVQLDSMPNASSKSPGNALATHF